MSEASELERLFFLLADLAPEAREAVLARENVSPELREKLQRMLAADAPRTRDPLAHPPGAGFAPGIQPGDEFDGYRMVERVGRGGMGDVWLARQETPVRREVALKVIKRGMDTEAIVARFGNERQALAVMDHPAVAKVYGAGATPGGRPYFAMEFVHGEPITDYCETHALDTRRRIELFLRVCDGVQHAHQKAIIHRDLKPSNVLVTEQDGVPVPKIIDFGVAKATQSNLVDVTLHTEYGVMIGTPEYMSPEQAEVSEQGVDTRTDVYSLGVMLYELLTGVLPFEPAELRSRGYESIRRVICERVPERPSSRITAVGKRGDADGPARDPATLRRQLAGDLDWITMKALEKDRERRYGSPAALAADLRRHLEDQPVLAGPPGARYRAGKFVRRHRAGVAASAAAVLTLVLFAGGMAWQAQRIAAERDRADLAAEQARKEAAAAERVSAVLTDMFAGANPDVTRGQEPTVRQVLDAGAARVLAELGAEPDVQARLLATIGDSYRGIGLWDEAIAVQEQMLAITVAAHGEDSIETARAKWLLSYPLIHRGQYDRAEQLNRESLATMRRVLPPGDPEIGAPITRLAFTVLRAQRDPTEMIPLLREALAAEKAAYGEAHDDIARTLDHLGWSMMALGRYEEARQALEEALAVVDTLHGGVHPRGGYLLARYVNVLRLLGRDVEAVAAGRRLVDLAHRLYGDNHPEVAYASRELGSVLGGLGQWDEALQHTGHAVELMRAFTGPDNSEYGGTVLRHGRTLWEAGRWTEADQALAEAARAFRVTLGDDHGLVALALRYEGDAARRLGQPERAVALLEQALAIRERGGGSTAAKAMDRVFHALALADAGRAEEATREAGTALETLAAEGAGDDTLALARWALGRGLAAHGDAAGAEPLLREGRAGLEAAYPPGHALRTEAESRFDALAKAGS